MNMNMGGGVVDNGEEHCREKEARTDVPRLAWLEGQITGPVKHNGCQENKWVPDHMRPYN